MSSQSNILSLIDEYVPERLKVSCDRWLRYDQNEETRSEILTIIGRKDWKELGNRLEGRIPFGTAGLRGRMEAGFTRMNSLVILQTSQGLAQYIMEKFPQNLSVVVGHDHRYHSKEFADITVATFLNAGFKVFYLNTENEFVHTPLVPYSVDKLRSACGVMITASHNPKDDNGYKVYYSNGCQIIPPHDKNIALTIEKNLTPWSKDWNWKDLFSTEERNGNLEFNGNKMFLAYVQDITRYVFTNGSPMLKTGKPWFVYTPMHGVGHKIFGQIAKQVLGLSENVDYFSVPEQIKPDPSFPTVSFPNPEEKGALDMAIQLAEREGLTLIIANDPDADRFSAAVKDKRSHEWRQLSGNEIGSLFAIFKLQEHKEKAASRKPLAMLNSTVSSQMLKKMAQVEGFHYEETLTGFKWIGNRALQLEQQGYDVCFGYEEAIGYMFPCMEHDKDGIIASVVFLHMYSKWLELEGLGPLDVLDLCFEKYGVFSEYNGYYTVEEPALIESVFSYIRDEYCPKARPYPEKLGREFFLTSFRDLTLGYQSDTIDFKPTLPVDASSQMITATLKPERTVGHEEIRFTIRGSGTEPKLKVYIESHAANKEAAANLAHLTWNVLRREWFRPEITGLKTSF
ncbi:hypothetical protein KAFR_0B03920 [Kazachstania africana CBS 2517]|uniref:phosphopentomutase n=1 Tax=Kazachstania africana (strain ATCC 22294 / BCRC 22015 / CBS 2517 / CECT 1963 / NBRC 1671 / NRRL Y-8276) TaxID=1071382 RepID=H2AQN8_KAZAF|nr:hypothetical protein KAFR_0B03920 [Kazachstania africana CBS 2517]CCF56688.1 hypothetical protein KAFR_0B03920 [Kazachstania africana CBS 2517]